MNKIFSYKLIFDDRDSLLHGTPFSPVLRLHGGSVRRLWSVGGGPRPPGLQGGLERLKPRKKM